MEHQRMKAELKYTSRADGEQYVMINGQYKTDMWRADSLGIQKVMHFLEMASSFF